MGTIIHFPRPADTADTIDDDPDTWQDDAACLGLDPEVFFRTDTRDAKEACRSCAVRLDCLEHALANGERFGVWGGLSERERRRVRRVRVRTRPA